MIDRVEGQKSSGVHLHRTLGSEAPVPSLYKRKLSYPYSLPVEEKFRNTPNSFQINLVFLRDVVG